MDSLVVASSGTDLETARFLVRDSVGSSTSNGRLLDGVELLAGTRATIRTQTWKCKDRRDIATDLILELESFE